MNTQSKIVADDHGIDPDLIDEVARELAGDDFNGECFAYERRGGEPGFHPEFGEDFDAYFESENDQGYYTDQARDILAAEMAA